MSVFLTRTLCSPVTRIVLLDSSIIIWMKAVNNLVHKKAKWVVPNCVTSSSSYTSKLKKTNLNLFQDQFCWEIRLQIFYFRRLKKSHNWSIYHCSRKYLELNFVWKETGTARLNICGCSQNPLKYRCIHHLYIQETTLSKIILKVYSIQQKEKQSKKYQCSN